MKKFVLLISGILMALIFSFSQTHIPAGHVSGTWFAASSPYIIDGEITLDTTDLLTIEPGVDVEFSGHYKFTIHGRLLAEGTETDSIHFYPQDTTIGWHGLRFDHTDLNEQDSSKLDYCTFKYGKALDGITYSDSTGGAIYCDSTSLLSIRNCLIERNKAQYGGAICLLYSNIVMDYLIVRNNITNKSTNRYRIGGGIEALATDIIINNSQIYNNTIGAEDTILLIILNDEVRIELNNVDIYNNNGGLVGGGMRVLSWNADLIFQNVNIYNNSADYGGGIFANFDLNVFENVNIYNNSALYGGGILLVVHNGMLSNAKIYGNNAEYGGGIYLSSCNNSQLMNCEIFDNNAVYGGGIKTFDSENIELRNLTFAGNSASSGGSVRIDTNSSVNISSCILWGNSDNEISIDETSTVDVNYSLISGGYPGTGNIDSDPLFTDTATNDYSLSWDHDPEPDSTKSPCIDTGNPLLIDPDGTRSDMGAIPYEQTYTPLTSGDISGTLLCSESPYYVYGDLTVPVGEELIIEPCVYVVFQDDYSLTVNGRLLAVGTESDRITFYPANTITGWQGIRFYDQNTNGLDSSKLVHCRVMYGNADELYGSNAYGGGIYMSNSSDVLVDNCSFIGNRAVTRGGGMYLTANSSPIVRNSTFLGNTSLNGGAIYCYDNVNSTFLNCYFLNNVAENGGAVMTYSCTPAYSGCSMVNNYATKFGGAIYHSANGAPIFDELNRCNIYDNYAEYAGLDFYVDDGYYTPPVLDVYLDTASVAMMNEHFAYPFNLFNFTAIHSRFIQENSDLYVSTSGSDLNSGTSEADPLKTIKTALIKIISNSTDPKSIHVAEGTYSYAETGETFPINHRSHVTLSGESRANTIFDGDSLTRLLISWADINDSVSNLTIQNGYKNGDGGAVVIENNSNPVFSDVTFKYNTSTNNGGAVWCEDECNPVFLNSFITNNYSDNSGGGLYLQSNEYVLIDHVTISSNTSRNAGGGIYSWGNDYFRISNSGIYNNELLSGGGGGAIFRDEEIILESVLFSGNNVIGSGGAIYADGSVGLEIKNCNFLANSASWYGGGVYFYNGVNLIMENVSFSVNSSGEGGAILGWINSSLNVKNGLFYNNFTIAGSSGSGEGGAIALYDVESIILNTTITDNDSYSEGGGLYLWASNPAVNCSIQNSILWGNDPDQWAWGGGPFPHIDYSVVDIVFLPDGHTIWADPDFVNPAAGDFQLNPGSPCINTGNPDTTGMSLPLFDLAENPRISNDTVDMGTYEFFEGIELDLKVFLEGPFNGTNMNTNLSDLIIIPIHHPYNSSPWNYSGTEEIFSTFPDNVVDWILIEVRDTTDVSLASPESVAGRQAIFLLDDGSLVNINGNNIKFGNPLDHQCFITIYHRNHLGIISAFPLTESGGVYGYDFTTPSGQAYGTDAQKDLGGGVYGMYGGNGNADETIDADDKTAVWLYEAGMGGYLYGDYNMDAQTDNSDKNEIWINNTGNSSQIPD